jgi:hypothetical protein
MKDGWPRLDRVEAVRLPKTKQSAALLALSQRAHLSWAGAAL